MEDNEIILEIKKNNNIHLPLGFMLLNNLNVGDLVKIKVEKYKVDENE